MQNIALSQYGRSSVTPAPVSKMMAQFATDFRDGIDVNLGVGYVNEETIPAHLIENALHHVLTHPDQYRQCLNYGDPQGSANLITAIKRFIASARLGGLGPDELARQKIVIGPSGVTSLLMGIAHVLPKGIVLTSDPMYYIYCHFLQRAGFTVVTVPEDHHGIRTDLLQTKIDSLGDHARNIRFIYVVTVNNPTCTILANHRRRQLLTITNNLSQRLDRKVPLIVDNAYEQLIHDPAVQPCRSSLLDDTAALVYELGTLSKIVAPALRVGYIIGQESNFLHALIQYVSDVGFSAPVITQEIAAYILDHHVDDQIANVNRAYHLKAQKVKKWIHQYLGDLLEDCTGGQAGFYFYLTFKNVLTHEDSPFFRYLTRTTGNPTIDGPPQHKPGRVIFIPGSFCVHPQGDLQNIGRRQLRISYAFENLERLQNALQTMRKAALYAMTP